MYAKSVATIANILEAAQTLFITKNYADVTMADIADAAEVTKGALYHHFDSKETLYVEMMLADLAEKQNILGAAAQTAGSCQEQLYQLTVAYLNLSQKKRELIRLVRRDVNTFTNPTREQLIRAYQAALPEQVEKIIREGMNQSVLAPTDTRLLAWEFVALVEVLLSDYAQRVLGDSDKLAVYVVDLFFNGATVAKMGR